MESIISKINYLKVEKNSSTIYNYTKAYLLYILAAVFVCIAGDVCLMADFRSEEGDWVAWQKTSLPDSAREKS